MHTHSITLALVLLTSTVFAAEKELKIDLNNAPSIKVSVPEEAGAEQRPDRTCIQIRALRVSVWPMANAKTVEEGIKGVADVIKTEFKEFVPDSTEAITVAGNPAKHLKGKGLEADDNDKSTGEVVIFTVGDRVYAACSHWEGEGSADERRTFLDVVKSVKAP